MKYNNIYLFTASYPYGDIENFIDTELPFLSESFKEIIILPLKAQERTLRGIPENCTVVEPLVKSRWDHYLKGLFNNRTYNSYRKEFIRNKVYSNLKRLKVFIISYLTANVLLNSSSLKDIINKMNDDDVIYFYWGTGSISILPFIRLPKIKKIVRFHGEWDLWEESSNGYAPMRKQIVSLIDKAFFISKKGMDYFQSKYQLTEEKCQVAYLGTKHYGISSKSNDGFFHLVSCSSVIPIKRVELIYNSLQLIKDIKITWTHIGGGSSFNELKRLTQNSHQNVSVRLLGKVPYSEVIAYFINNPVDAFINVSSTEGLPVSLMEAISFDVPIIATDVGGTSEIVTEDTGILLPANPTYHQVAEAILKIQTLQLNPEKFWRDRFDASVNYPKFITDIYN